LLANAAFLARVSATAAVRRVRRRIHAGPRAFRKPHRAAAQALPVDADALATGIAAAAAVLDTGGSVHTRALASREPRRADAFAVDAELALEAGAIASATMCRIRIRIHAGTVAVELV